MVFLRSWLSSCLKPNFRVLPVFAGFFIRKTEMFWPQKEIKKKGGKASGPKVFAPDASVISLPRGLKETLASISRYS